MDGRVQTAHGKAGDFCGKCELYCPADARKICGKEYTIDEVLKEILDCKILKPQKGNKYSLVQMAIDNARESLEKKFELIQKNEAATIGAMKQLGELLQIETPHVIELFDNSNIQGAYAVAGMVCFKDGIPSKKDYRKYKIKTV